MPIVLQYELHIRKTTSNYGYCYLYDSHAQENSDNDRKSRFAKTEERRK